MTTKVWVDHLEPARMRKAMDASLRALRTEYVDLYMIHWPSPDMDLGSALEGLAGLQREGKARRIGVANFNLALMRRSVEEFGAALAAEQFEFHAMLRQPALLDYLRGRGIPVIAYSPLAKGQLVHDETIGRIARKHGPRRRRSRCAGCSTSRRWRSSRNPRAKPVCGRTWARWTCAWTMRTARRSRHFPRTAVASARASRRRGTRLGEAERHSPGHVLQSMVMRRLRHIAATVALGALSACGPFRLLDATVPSGGVRVTRDLHYGEGPRRTLDVYQPPTPGQDRPLVVFFYGGSWKTGAKEDYRFVATALARRGMVVVVPDYRLYPQTAFPGFVQDSAAAVAWAAAHAALYGADSHPFVVGHSAGAYIALMLALNPAYLDAAGLPRSELAGAVGIAGPYDFHPRDYPDIAAIFAAANEPATQPITYAYGTNKPVLLLAGDADQTVRPYNTRALAARIAAHGGPVETRIYPDLGHIGILLAFAPLFTGKAPVVADISRFIVARDRNLSVVGRGTKQPASPRHSGRASDLDGGWH